MRFAIVCFRRITIDEKFQKIIITIIFLHQEWGNSCPHEFIDSYRLEYDMSWTKEEYIDVRDQELSVIEGILNTGVPRLEFLVNAAHEKPAQLHHGHPVIEEQN